MERQDTLSQRVTDGKALSVEDQRQLFELLTKRCSEKTKNMVAMVLRCVPDVYNHYCYQRLHCDDGIWSYCAGQDYRYELPRVRNTMIGR